jgi:hypothetical protein
MTSILNYLYSFFVTKPTSSIPELVQQLGPEAFSQSRDQGGHGGTVKVEVPVQGAYLFLKPKSNDATELRNYQVIQATDPDIARWMPTIHGEVERNGRPFLIMDNVLKSKENQKLRQLVDIKLAKQVDGLHTPIMSDQEMLVTRGKKKSLLTRIWMRVVCTIGPGFLITNGGVRLADYILSKRILKKSLADISTAHLHKLAADLAKMKEDLERGGIAFIGASIILVHQQDGSVRPILIDPAHIQCSQRLAGKVLETLGTEESTKVFYEEGSKHDTYRLFKQSNAQAIEAIIATLQKIIAERKN